MSLISDIGLIADKLASIYLLKGIQPSEIIDAIYDKQYSSVTVNKSVNEIILIATFTESDDIDGKEYKHQLKYTYSKNKHLQTIEHKIGAKAFKMQWSRQDELDKLLNQFVDLVKPFVTSDKLDIILSTLPKDIRPQVDAKLKLVA